MKPIAKIFSPTDGRKPGQNEQKNSVFISFCVVISRRVSSKDKLAKVLEINAENEKLRFTSSVYPVANKKRQTFICLLAGGLITLFVMQNAGKLDRCVPFPPWKGNPIWRNYNKPILS